MHHNNDGTDIILLHIGLQGAAEASPGDFVGVKFSKLESQVKVQAWAGHTFSDK